MATIAEDYNNPGNIRPPKGVTYEGQVGIGDKGFAIFETPEYGRKALIGDIQHKVQNGLNTPDAFIDKYAPSVDNPEQGRDNYKIHLMEKLGLKSSSDPFPKDSHEKIADAIAEFESGKFNKPKENENLGGDNTAQAQADTSQHPNKTVNTDPNTLPGNEASKLHALEVPAALAGAGVSAGLELGHGAYTIKNNLINQALRQPVNPNKPITRTGLNAYMPSQLPEDLRSMHLSDLENEVTKARQLKDPKAGKVKLRTMSEVQDAIKEVKGSPAERVAKTTSVDPRTGQPKKIYSIKEGSAPIDLAKYKVNPDTPILNKVVGVAKNAKTFVAPQLMKLGSGALGGLGALSSANDFKNEYEKHGLNNWRTIAKGAGTLGGGLMMVPSPWTEIPGAALSAVGMVPDVVDYFSGEDK